MQTSGYKALLRAPFRALAGWVDETTSKVPLKLTGMGAFPPAANLEELLDGKKTCYWEAHPELTLPKHHGFLKELTHSSEEAPIPYWMSVDEGAWAPAVRFTHLKHAIIWLFDGVAMRWSGEVIDDSCFTLLERSDDLTVMPGTEKGRKHVVFDRRTLKNVRTIDEPILVAANGWNRAFGHWIYDSLTAIHTFIEPLRSGRLRLLIAELTPWQREWLKLMGIHDSAILECGFGHVKAKHAIVASSLSIQNVRYPGPHTVELINHLRTLAAKTTEPAPYLYLSRLGRDSHRILEEEEAIIASLRPLGFKTIAPESLSPAEQIALFSQARVILGPVGSAFALSGLAATGACILEILPPPAAHSWIFRSSANFGHYYGCIMAEVIKDSQRDLDEHGIERPGWFYRYRVNRDALLRIAKHAIELSS